jgi:hypothetical protein
MEKDLKEYLFKTVIIKPLGNITGKVTAVFINEAGIQFNVRYFDNKSVIFEYFFINELDFDE